MVPHKTHLLPLPQALRCRQLGRPVGRLPNLQQLSIKSWIVGQNVIARCVYINYVYVYRCELCLNAQCVQQDIDTTRHCVPIRLRVTWHAACCCVPFSLRVHDGDRFILRASVANTSLMEDGQSTGTWRFCYQGNKWTIPRAQPRKWPTWKPFQLVHIS